MLLIEKIEDLRSFLKETSGGKTIGFVPTMGCLHEGHISLIARSVSENNITVVSIFVNPLQFGIGEDYDRYPKTLEDDKIKCEKAGATVIFYPSVDELYPEGYNTFVEVKKVTDTLCGTSRPGHFLGVTTIVLKLFNIVKPTTAYFGQKDAQQATVIKKMVEDLNINIQVTVCPIVRESDGLAMSSRNKYLSPAERAQAIVISKAMQLAKSLTANGETDPAKIKAAVISLISEKKLAHIEYVEIVNIKTLLSVETINNQALLAVAVKFGTTRLIDNVILEENLCN